MKKYDWRKRDEKEEKKDLMCLLPLGVDQQTETAIFVTYFNTACGDPVVSYRTTLAVEGILVA